MSKIFTIDDFLQQINELQIEGKNLPIKVNFDGQNFFVKQVLLKNNNIEGSYCSIELGSEVSSSKEELLKLTEFFEQNFKNDEVNSEIELKAIEGIKKIKEILNK
tara:strand:+ start:911 stop:1225 length:315 start_codon:yes stop_codon:yes gene_type:complete